MSPVPVAPRPIPGELRSSWVARLAAVNGLTIQHLLDHVLGSPWGQPPIDGDATPSLIAGLAKVGGISEMDLRALDVHAQFPQAPPWAFLPDVYQVSDSKRYARWNVIAFLSGVFRGPSEERSAFTLEGGVVPGIGSAMPQTSDIFSRPLPSLLRWLARSRRASAKWQHCCPLHSLFSRWRFSQRQHVDYSEGATCCKLRGGTHLRVQRHSSRSDVDRSSPTSCISVPR